MSYEVHIVIDIEAERKEQERIEREADALLELKDFIQSHPDIAIREGMRFFPPIDARVLKRAIEKEYQKNHPV